MALNRLCREGIRSLARVADQESAQLRQWLAATASTSRAYAALPEPVEGICAF